MNRNQNIHQKLGTLTALIAFTASTAFAAGSAPTPKASTATPTGQNAPVCAPHDRARGPQNGQPGRGGPRGNAADATTKAPAAPAAGTTAPNAAAPTGKTPPALKNAPARPAAGAQAPANCGPMGGGPMDGGPMGGHRGGPDGQGQQAPGTPADAAARTQNDLTRIDALLAKTTDAKARGYLTDARSLITSGNVRAAHDLIRAAEALTGGQK